MFKLNSQQILDNLEKNFIKKDIPILKIGDNVKIGVKIKGYLFVYNVLLLHFCILVFKP